MALYFECRINKKRTPLYCFFGDFAHWVQAMVRGVQILLMCKETTLL